MIKKHIKTTPTLKDMHQQLGGDRVEQLSRDASEEVTDQTRQVVGAGSVVVYFVW